MFLLEKIHHISLLSLLQADRFSHLLETTGFLSVRGGDPGFSEGELSTLDKGQPAQARSWEAFEVKTFFFQEKKICLNPAWLE